MSDEELKRRLAEAFQAEAEEHISSLAANVELLHAGGPADLGEVVDRLFREAHNFKGAARLVGATEIEDACHSLEETLSAIRSDPKSLTGDIRDLLLRKIRDLTKLHQESSSEPATSGREAPRNVLDVTESAPREHPAQARFSGSVRVPAQRLDSLLLQSEELVSVKLTLGAQIDSLRKLKSALAAELHFIDSLRQQLRGESMRQTTLSEQLSRHRDALVRFDHDYERILGKTQETQRNLERSVDLLLEETRDVLMLPFSTVVDGFGFLVQELTEAQQKSANLLVEGGEIEIAKGVLEQLRDPLVHLIRNSVDHGVESKEERVSAGKTESATIKINASYTEGGRVAIQVSDDGRGIDPAILAARSRALGLTPSDSQPDEIELLNVIFHPGFSTREKTTNVSGRGLGLAIARENVERMGGTIHVENVPGQGARFTLVVPSSLLRIRGVVLRLQDRHFVVPSAYVEKVTRLRTEDLSAVRGRQTTNLNGEAVVVAELGAVLALTRGTPMRGKIQQAIIINSNRRRVAFLADEIHHEQDIVVKPLGKRPRNVRMFTGATLLGTGEMALVLNGTYLLDSLFDPAAKQAELPLPSQSAKRKSTILLVEDSITSRTLLRSILQSAGYGVKVAVDGVEALATLKLEKVDLVVSDVQMPRMDGFELTRQMRQSPTFKDLPVILITSLGSREDKERGVDAGANAYIVKGTLEQGSFLQTIRRFIQ